jgi:uncharacterized protein (TIGR02452 family)
MWDARRWLAEFRGGGDPRALRREVFAGTVEAARARRYTVEGRTIEFGGEGAVEHLREAAVFHRGTDRLVVSDDRRGRHRTSVAVLNADVLEVARAIAMPALAPAVLNMANAAVPGGGVLNGAGAQEENLFRRSDLFLSLYQFSEIGARHGVAPHPEGLAYPIPPEGCGIYSPRITALRSSEDTGYAFLARPFEIAVVTVPAIDHPAVEERDGTERLAAAEAALTAHKIAAILRIAAHHGHTELVLSAFGCGAFGNPPQHVAELFAEALRTPEFDGVFRRVVFAILDDANARAPLGNYLSFERALAPLARP